MDAIVDLSQERSLAIAAVRAASAVCRSVQHRLVAGQTLEKGDKSPVTIADFASQAIALGLLDSSSSIRKFVGEEDAAALRADDGQALREQVVEQVRSGFNGSDRGISGDDVLDWIDLGAHEPTGASDTFWTLDPIDGTKGFLRGEQYAVALGLLHRGEVVLGVLGCPNLQLPGFDAPGAVLVAARGHGASALPLEGETGIGDGDEAGMPIRVSDIDDPAACRFVESVESGHSDHSQSSDVAVSLGTAAEPVRMDSQCKYAAVAAALAEVYLRLPTREGYEEKIWDHAAGSIVVQEAGGIVSDVRGEPLDFSRGRTLSANAGVIATHGSLHDR
ncbi:MAG: 3'(2'),5'-bisphosphate nucleotidase, partial [Phycisphaeraceae bacterium]